jgi:hypothetical protein
MMRQSIPLGLKPQNPKSPNRFERDKSDARQLQLRRWGLQLRFRGGKLGIKRAIVVVARKLAVLRLWKRALEILHQHSPDLTQEFQCQALNYAASIFIAAPSRMTSPASRLYKAISAAIERPRMR